MKKIIVLLLITTTFAAVTKAQTVHLGIKAGANLTKINGESFKDEYDLGYQLGGYLSVDFNKNWGIQPEVLFNQTNTKIESGTAAIYQNIPSKAHLDYLSIPLLLRLNAGKLLTFNVGPQYSILMNKDLTLVQNGKNAFKSGDLSAVLGAQLNLHPLKVYARYNIGLNNINDIGQQDKWTSRQWQIGVGFNIL